MSYCRRKFYGSTDSCDLINRNQAGYSSSIGISLMPVLLFLNLFSLSTGQFFIPALEATSSWPQELRRSINLPTVSFYETPRRKDAIDNLQERTLVPQQIQSIFDISFQHDYPKKFDPRNANNAFEFQMLEDEQLLDNAAFMRIETTGLLDMVSVPFGRWLPQSRGLPATAAVYDATAATRKPLRIANDEVLSARLVFNCRTIGERDHRFPRGSVANASSDPRLASCGLYLTDLTTGTGLEFAILLTQESIWATYSRQVATRVAIQADFESFDVYRRIGSRSNSRNLVDAVIEIDRSRGETRYFIDQHLVWTVYSWGILTQQLREDRKNKFVSYTPSTAVDVATGVAARPQAFTLSIINAHKMDVSDPNEEEITTLALVKLTDQTDYYARHVEFVDERSNRFSSLFGQGSIAGLKRLVVVKRKST